MPDYVVGVYYVPVPYCVVWTSRKNFGLCSLHMHFIGNPLKTGFISEPCYNLIYLELAACRLTVLPQDFARMLPNLRVLNLNYNFLEETRALEGLTRLRKLTIIGSRINATKHLIRVLRGMRDVEMLDFRYVLSVLLPLCFASRRIVAYLLFCNARFSRTVLHIFASMHSFLLPPWRSSHMALFSHGVSSLLRCAAAGGHSCVPVTRKAMPYVIFLGAFAAAVQFRFHTPSLAASITIAMPISPILMTVTDSA